MVLTIVVWIIVLIVLLHYSQQRVFTRNLWQVHSSGQSFVTSNLQKKNQHQAPSGVFTLAERSLMICLTSCWSAWLLLALRLSEKLSVTVSITCLMSSLTETRESWKPVLSTASPVILLLFLKSTHISPAPFKQYVNKLSPDQRPSGRGTIEISVISLLH